MAIVKQNHEIWAVCPKCGCEYDRRVWGDTCPKCARRTMDEIKDARHATTRVRVIDQCQQNRKQ